MIPIKARAKEPAVKWTRYQQEIASEERLAKWLRQFPDANLGIITGRVSNLAVIDLDGDTAKAREWFKSQGVELPPANVKTPKGEHIYFQHPGMPVPTKSWIVQPGFASDLRGDGGYVVAPPSIHRSGRMYLHMQDDDVLPVMPKVLQAMLSQQHKDSGTTRPSQIPQHEIERVLRSVDVKSLVEGCGIELTPQGASQFAAHCPFADHNDRIPSFSVNVDNAVWRCFGCGRSGNVIQLLQQLNAIGFPEAFRRVATAAECKSRMHGPATGRDIQVDAA